MTSINYSENYEIDLVPVEVSRPGEISQNEFARIEESLRINGLAVVKKFFTENQLTSLTQDALQCVHPNFDAGESLGLAISAKISLDTSDFSHPFLVSKSAVDLVTNVSIINVVEGYINDKAIVHHALFQQSVPRETSAVDWHVDTGSNKALNGSKRFPDKRLRMIVYLSDVTAGGLSYLLDTREAAQYFLRLPNDALFPEDEVPQLEGRRVTVNERAGTVMFFDAHGLHKPDPPVDSRLVLNVWFARSDFSGALPPTLVSLAALSEAEIQRAYVFKNARGFSFGNREGAANENISVIYKLKRFINKLF